MSTIIQLPENGKYRIYTKGASEIVLDLCTTYLTTDGNISPLTDGLREQLKNRIEGMADQGKLILYGGVFVNDLP